MRRGSYWSSATAERPRTRSRGRGTGMIREFAGKVAIVSGAAGGIGSVILRRFAEAGARAVIADLDEERAAGVVRQLIARDHEVRFVRTDVRDSAQVDAMVRTAV